MEGDIEFTASNKDISNNRKNPALGVVVYGIRGVFLSLIIGIIINIIYYKYFKYGSDGIFYGTENSYFFTLCLSSFVLLCGIIIGPIIGFFCYKEKLNISTKRQLIFWSVHIFMIFSSFFLFIYWILSSPGFEMA